jgi:hypothetical protein
MLLPIASLLLATVLPVQAGPGPGPGAWYTTGNPEESSEHVAAKFCIDPSSQWAQGYYAAAQFHFQGHDVHYFGLQPRTSEKNTTGHLTYSVFGNGSSVGDPQRCRGGADGGSGVSCSMKINFEAGKWYTIESTVVEKRDGSRRWNGTFIDDTGKRTYIASFWTDASYKTIGWQSGQWLEWYEYNNNGKTPAENECTPYFKMHYGKPMVNGKPSKKYAFFKGRKDDKCAIAHNQNNYNNVLTEDGDLLITSGMFSPSAPFPAPSPAPAPALFPVASPTPEPKPVKTWDWSCLFWC